MGSLVGVQSDVNQQVSHVRTALSAQDKSLQNQVNSCHCNAMSNCL